MNTIRTQRNHTIGFALLTLLSAHICACRREDGSGTLIPDKLDSATATTAASPDANTHADSSNVAENTPGGLDSGARRDLSDAATDAHTTMNSDAGSAHDLGDIRAFEKSIIDAMKRTDIDLFANLVDPKRGCRMSVWGAVRPATDLVLTSKMFSAAKQDKQKRHFGSFHPAHGPDEPIDETIADFFRTHVWPRNYLAPSATSGVTMPSDPIAKTRVPSDVRKVYPSAAAITYFDPGSDPSGMDWASVTFVIEKIDSKWKIVAIVHNHWQM